MLKKISINESRVGMFIQEVDVSWLDNPFWKKSFKIDSQADLQKLLSSKIKTITIDTTKGFDVLEESEIFDQPAIASVEEGESSQVSTELESVASQIKQEQKKVITKNLSLQPTTAAQEREFATRAIQESKQAVESMFNDVRMGKAVSTEAAIPIIEELTSSVIRNQGALISLVRLKTQDDYTYMHSVAVCALMIALAKQLNLSEAETKQAGLAGLMHDIGKAAIPEEVLNKAGALTDEEFTLVKLHPERGLALLNQAQVTDEVTLDVCLHHHEKIDGSGYPHRLKGDEISLFAKMGAVCDVYDAITSNRPYKAGWEPGLSLQRMAQWKNHFDPDVFKAFVKSVGIYPIGTVVKLKSDHLGVVVDQTAKSLLKPMVKLFFLINTKEIIEPFVIDLSDESVDDKIIGQEEPAVWGFKDISQYWSE
jgi:putative nucleotidyltransferase with HDIG domain